MSQVFSALTRSERLLPVEDFDILEKTTAYRTLFLSHESNVSLHNRVSLYWQHYGQREQKQRFYRRVISSTRVPVRMCRFAGMPSRPARNSCSRQYEQTEPKMEIERSEKRLESKELRSQNEKENEQHECNMAAHFMRISIPHNISTRHFVKLLAPYENLLCPNLLCSPLMPLTVIFNQETLSTLRESSFNYFASNALCRLVTEIAQLATKFNVPLGEAKLFVSCSLLYIEVMANKFLNLQNETCIAQNNEINANRECSNESINDKTNIFINTAPANITLTTKHFVQKLKEHTLRLIHFAKEVKEDYNAHNTEREHLPSSHTFTSSQRSSSTPCNKEIGKNDHDNKLRDKYHVILRLYELALNEWQHRHEVLEIQHCLNQRCKANSQSLTSSTPSLVKVKNVTTCEESRSSMTIAYAPRDLPVKVWEDVEMSEHHSHHTKTAQIECEPCTASTTTNDLELATEEKVSGNSNELEFFIPFESRDTNMSQHMFHLPRLPCDPAELLIIHVWESVFLECVRDKAKVYTFRELLIEHVQKWAMTKVVCNKENNTGTNERWERNECYSLQEMQSKELCTLQSKWEQQVQQQKEEEYYQKIFSKQLSHEIVSCEHGNGVLNYNSVRQECFFSIHIPSCLSPAHELWVTNNTCGINWNGYKNVLHCFCLCTSDTHLPHECAKETTFLIPAQRIIAFDDYVLQLTSKSLFCTLEELADWIMRVGMLLSRLPVSAQARQMFVFTRSQMMYIMHVLKNAHEKELYMQCEHAGLHEMRLRISLNGFLLTYIRDDGVETKLTTLSQLLLPVFAKLTNTLSVSRLRHVLTRYWLHNQIRETTQEVLSCDKLSDNGKTVQSETSNSGPLVKSNVSSSGNNEVDNIERELPSVLSAVMNSGYDALELYLLAIITLREHTICRRQFSLQPCENTLTTSTTSNIYNSDAINTNKNSECNGDEAQRNNKHEHEHEEKQQLHELEQEKQEFCHQLCQSHVEKKNSSTTECECVADKTVEFEVIKLTPKEQKVVSQVLRSHPHITYITGCGIHDIMLCTPSLTNRKKFNEEVTTMLTSSKTTTRLEGCPSYYRTDLQCNLPEGQSIKHSVNKKEVLPLLLLVVRTCGTFVQVDVSNCYHGHWLHELASPVLVMPSNNKSITTTSHRSLLPLPANVLDADNRILFDNVQDMLWYYFDSLHAKQSLSSCESINNNSTTDNDNNVESNLETKSKSSERNEQQRREFITQTILYPTDKAVALYVIRHHPEYYSCIRGCGIAEVFVAYKRRHKENEQEHLYSSIHQSDHTHLHKNATQLDDNNLQHLKNSYKNEPTFLIKCVCGTCVEVDFTQCYDTTTTPYILRPHQVICKPAKVRTAVIISKPRNIQKRSRCEQQKSN